jgi:hypothetical protein
MSQAIKIQNYRKEIGAIKFEESPTRLSAERTATGFKLALPAILTLDLVAKGEAHPLISNLAGIVSAKNGIEVGRLQNHERYSCGWSSEPGETERQITLWWYGAFADMSLFEKIRDGNTPELYIQLRGELCYGVPNINSQHLIRTEPQTIYGSITLTYPKETWIQTLRSIGIMENVLVEIPLPSAPPGNWDGVWRALAQAREAFEQGGSTGWKGCVDHVRLALERWRGIETEDLGPGGLAATRTQRENRTKHERYENLRYHLMQCAHLGPHSGAENWTRDDAVLMLATLSALLAERKP